MPAPRIGLNAPDREALPRPGPAHRARGAGLWRRPARARRQARSCDARSNGCRCTRSTASMCWCGRIICPPFRGSAPMIAALIDRAAWGRKPERRLFEYWAHEASLLPLDLHPLLRWRMARADRGEAGWPALRRFAHERRAAAEAVLARIRAEGPLAASDFEEGKSTSRLVGLGREQARRWNGCSGPGTSPPRPGATASSGSMT